MKDREALETKRLEILEEMGAITRMRRGTVNERYLDVRQKDGSMVRHGPHYLYSRTERGKSFSKRIRHEEVERYRGETENCRRFKELSNRCVVICEELAEADQDNRKKTAEAKEERLSEIDRFRTPAAKAYARSGAVDMEALEQGMGRPR